MADQRDDAVPDQAGRRVVPGHDQLEDRGEQFLLVEAFVAVTRADQRADEVVAGFLALRLNEHRQLLDDRVGRPLRGGELIGRRRGREQRRELTPERRPLERGYAEQLADHRSGSGTGRTTH